jgi:hypothetical protein
VFVNSLPQEVWRGAMLLTCAAALWRGGWPERIAAGAVVVASFASPFLLNPHAWFDPQWGIFAVDIGLLAVFLGLTVRTTRTWVLFAAAFQLVNVITHLAMLADNSVAPLPYRRGLVIWSYLVLAALAAGAWEAWRKSPPAA